MNLSYLRDRVKKIVTEQEVSGEINIKGTVKYDGVFIPRAFFHNKTYKETIKKLTDTKELNRMLSNIMIIGTFNKLIRTYIDNRDNNDLVRGIKGFEKYASARFTYNIYVPIKGLEMSENKIALSRNVEIIKIDEQSISDQPPQLKYDSDISHLYPTALRAEIISADFRKAMEMGIEIGKYVVNYLRLIDYHGWDKGSLTVRLPGYGFIQEELRVFAVDKNGDGVHSWRDRKTDDNLLEIDTFFLEDIEKLGKKAFGDLLDKHLSYETSDLDNSILRSITWFGEAKVELDQGARFIKLMLAIESLFNSNINDPITATLRDRLAFVLGETIEERIEISSQFTDLYKLRSKIVHHGSSHVGYEELLNLQDRAANAIVEFLMNEELLALKDKKELQSFFEKKKFSS
ncbi:hypothetical protein ACFPRA_01280 [Sporosarcina soli]|uniref:Apea-like HEPN domain-containing protein n=1 Tax=Sporosarcina soli TaxID=334736 RepID=A0ABW0TE18_9BACL